MGEMEKGEVFNPRSLHLNAGFAAYGFRNLASLLFYVSVLFDVKGYC